jgi:hypothetical protein
LIIVVGTLAPSLGLAQAFSSGGRTCIQNYALFDYYQTTGGERRLITSAWEPDGVSCFDTGSTELGSIRDWFIDNVGGWFVEQILVVVPNNPNNSTSATCQADVGSRHAHAHQDVAPYAALRLLGGEGLAPGDEVLVTYDDGGTERWIAVGGLPSATADSIEQIPVAGSLKCP